HPDEVYTKERLTLAAWDESYHSTSRTLNKHVNTLRKKLGPYGENIKTIRGIGYKITFRTVVI
ncbi:MAG: winged helix-turn-helix domain-containing protein, partial [Elusimicrobia bacterium]|nr:winged helix-turn-helix domain-containing protein [Elusimicrobiota bacterium]